MGRSWDTFIFQGRPLWQSFCPKIPTCPIHIEQLVLSLPLRMPLFSLRIMKRMRETAVGFSSSNPPQLSVSAVWKNVRGYRYRTSLPHRNRKTQAGFVLPYHFPFQGNIRTFGIKFQVCHIARATIGRQVTQVLARLCIPAIHRGIFKK